MVSFYSESSFDYESKFPFDYEAMSSANLSELERSQADEFNALVESFLFEWSKPKPNNVKLSINLQQMRVSSVRD